MGCAESAEADHRLDGIQTGEQSVIHGMWACDVLSHDIVCQSARHGDGRTKTTHGSRYRPCSLLPLSLTAVSITVLRTRLYCIRQSDREPGLPACGRVQLQVRLCWVIGYPGYT